LIVRQPCAARMIFVTLHDAEGKPAGTHLLWNKRCSLLKTGRYQLHGVFIQQLSGEELERVLRQGLLETAVGFGSSRRR
jgi:hypothetical protein